MDEQKIREAAYLLWEKEGKPQGADLEHWFKAEQSDGEQDFDSSISDSKMGSENAPSQADNTAEPGTTDDEGR